jgi:hypothetical protein
LQQLLIKILSKMKKLILILLLPLFAALHINAQTNQPAPAPPAPQAKPAVPVNPNAPVAKWDKMVNDFGEIAFNVPKSAEFTLTNDGKEPLIISSARASCGCTNLKYSQEPILPGKTSVVSATYNAASQGVFTKTVTVTTNANPNPVVLQIKGTVLPNPNPPPPPAPPAPAPAAPAAAPAAPK